MLEVDNAENIDESMKLEFLSHKQLREKYRCLSEKMNAEKLKNFYAKKTDTG